MQGRTNNYIAGRPTCSLDAAKYQELIIAIRRYAYLYLAKY